MAFKTMHLKFEREDGRTLEAGRLYELQVTGTEGFEKAEADIDVDDHVFYAGSRIKKYHVPYRLLKIELTYGNLSKTEEMSQRLISFFNPGIKGNLTVEIADVSRSIDYVFKSYEEEDRNLWEPLKATIELACMQPYFEDPSINRIDLTTWEGGLKLPHAGRFKLRHRTAPTLLLHNNGHVATPVRILFKGPAKYPRVTNETAGEFIEVNTTLTASQTLEVITEYGKKSVKIIENGVSKNAYNLISLSSRFWELLQGDNVLRYSSADGANRVQEVAVFYKRRYAGI
jgi:hypothetical protein